MIAEQTRVHPCFRLLFATSLLLACGAGETHRSIALLDDLARRHKIEIVTDNPGFPVKTYHGPIDGQVADDQGLQTYCDLFSREFSLYPTELVTRAKLKRIVLCKELTFDGQRRNAIPDYEHDTLYYDVSRGAYNRLYLRKVIHHEFFHVVDYRDDGEVYRDDTWLALNPESFHYGSGGRNAQNLESTSIMTSEFPGFLNHYSTTGVEEDKAEVFANLIVDPAHVGAESKKDPVLDLKVKRMKALMSAFCPELDSRFWAKAGLIKRID